MIIELLKKIKTSCPGIWSFIEGFNGFLVSFLYGGAIQKQVERNFDSVNEIAYRVLQREDAESLVELIASQPKGFDEYFKPHAFDLSTFRKVLQNRTYLLIGAFDGNKLIGYCFLRFAVNKAAYRGKMVDKTYQGRGIAKQMGIFMTRIAIGAGFRLFATISKHNLASMHSSKAVNEIKVIKELPDDYVYIEYIGLK